MTGKAHMKVKRASALAVAVLAFGSFSGIAQAVQPESVPTATKHYTSCKAMNKGAYPHGVGKKGAHDKSSGKKVTNFTRNNKVYWLFSAGKSKTGYYDLDRDNDGIACEKA
jgi:hypothetical protein